MQAQLLFKAGAELGEGALWDSEAARLLWLDITGSKVFRFDPATGANEAYDSGSHVGAVVPIAGGGLMLAVKNGFCRMDLPSGRLEMAAAMEMEAPTIRFNDGKCDPAGRFWAGTMAYGGRAGAGNLFCLERDFGVSRKIKGVSVSNGLGWSPDSTRMYYIDTPTQRVLEFQYDISSGSIQSPRVAVEFPVSQGHPDGMCVDAEGMLWVAMFNGGKVLRLDPSSGIILGEVSVPGVRQTTSCALGGSDLKTLFITTAREHFSPQENESQPLAGSLFSARVSVPGLPTNPFRPL